jgi:hypothetical protein
MATLNSPDGYPQPWAMAQSIPMVSIQAGFVPVSADRILISSLL